MAPSAPDAPAGRTARTSDGADVWVHDLGGDPGSPVALCCHATGFHGGVWAPLIAELGGRLRGWALDHRGHGRSDAPVVVDGRIDWHGFALDVLGAVDALGLPTGRTVGLGHSMGGAALALAELERPGTFAGLWLFEPIISPPFGSGTGRDGAAAPADNPLALGAARRRPTFDSPAAALANYAGKPPLDRLRADALWAYVRHGFETTEHGVELRCRPEHEAATFAGAGGHDAFDRLGELRCPLVIAAGDDAVGPGGFAPQVAARAALGTVDRVEGVGHFGPLEAPRLLAGHVARAVTGFGLAVAPAPTTMPQT